MHLLHLGRHLKIESYSHTGRPCPSACLEIVHSKQRTNKTYDSKYRKNVLCECHSNGLYLLVVCFSSNTRDLNGCVLHLLQIHNFVTHCSVYIPELKTSSPDGPCGQHTIASTHSTVPASCSDNCEDKAKQVVKPSVSLTKVLSSFFVGCFL